MEDFLVQFFWTLAFLVFFIYLIFGKTKKKTVKFTGITNKPEAVKIELVEIKNETDKCPKCGTGVLAYSTTNINLEERPTIEYFFCLNCKADTAFIRL